MITVASYIAKFLKEKNVQHIFGFQGSAMLKMLDEIVGAGIKYVQNFNEQASSFAADAYARINGHLGVAVGTSGPGAANLIGGIANAYFDSVPVMFITGQDYTNAVLANNGARQNGFQDMDIVSMVKPITKYAVLLDKPENVRYELEKAYYMATSERKGSVLIDVPIDVQFKEIDENNLRGFEKPQKEKYDFKTDAVVCALKEAKRPLILAGGGIRGANAIQEFRTFVQKTNIPVVSTLNGLDAASNIVGFSGIFGNTGANLAILNADLLVVLGARFARQHVGKNKQQYANMNAKIIHVDIDITENNRTFMQEDITINADLKEFLSAMNQCVTVCHIEKWQKTIKNWQEQYRDTVCLAEKNVDPVKLIREIAKYAPENTIFTADVGANQMWVAQALRLKENQRLLNSAGFGAMGYSLPAAIGASYVSKDVVCFTGDGGLQMNLQELNTLSLRKNNVKCFVFNNNNLALMRNLQKNFYNNHFYGNNEKEFTCPNLQKLADTFALGYEKIEKESDFVKLKEILKSEGAFVIEVVVDKDLIPLNRSIDKALENG